MTRIAFSADDTSERDPMTGAELGHPSTAVRVGIAVAFALALARVGNLAILSTVRDRPITGWGTEWHVAFATGLPIGAALAVAGTVEDHARARRSHEAPSSGDPPLRQRNPLRLKQSKDTKGVRTVQRPGVLAYAGGVTP